MKGILSGDDDRLFRENISLLEEQVVANARDAATPAILSAIRAVPRHLFVAGGYRALAYTDNALPTSGGLTTSAPSVIALMIHEAGVEGGTRVLEVGTGTGYQAALLAEMGAAVRSIEVEGALAREAAEILVRLGYKRPIQADASAPVAGARGEVRLYHGNGMRGCPEGAPYGAIILAAAVPALRYLRALTAELSPHHGRLVAPVGPRHDQELVLIEREGDALRRRVLEGVSLDFVPMILPEGIA